MYGKTLKVLKFGSWVLCPGCVALPGPTTVPRSPCLPRAPSCREAGDLAAVADQAPHDIGRVPARSPDLNPPKYSPPYFLCHHTLDALAQRDPEVKHTLDQLQETTFRVRAYNTGVPTPPLTCRVGNECKLTLATRTADGVQLPHGGVQMRGMT